jgi:hypothetical protein
LNQPVGKRRFAVATSRNCGCFRWGTALIAAQIKTEAERGLSPAARQ